MPDHPLLFVYGAFAAIFTAIVAATVTRVQRCPT
jgi:hypothetical protein